MNIFFTCAGRRTYLLNYFKENLSAGDKIVAGDMQATAPALTAADIKVKLPSVYDDNYIDTLIEICKKHNIRLLISLNDLELPILAAHKDRFASIGTIVVVSDSQVIDACFDKWKTTEFAKSIDIDTPKTFISVNDAASAFESGFLNLPIIIKPRWGSGSIGIEIIYDAADLLPTYRLLEKKVKRSILGKASSEDSPIVIQEFIPGTEYGIDIINDFNGHLASISIKQKLAMRAGETDKAVTVHNDEIYSICANISHNLKHIGNLDCDIIEHNGRYYLIDLNPRFGGGFPFSYVAGVNLPKAFISWANGNSVTPDTLTAQIGICSAKCDTLVHVDSDAEVGI